MLRYHISVAVTCETYQLCQSVLPLSDTTPAHVTTLAGHNSSVTLGQLQATAAVAVNQFTKPHDVKIAKVVMHKNSTAVGWWNRWMTGEQWSRLSHSPCVVIGQLADDCVDTGNITAIGHILCTYDTVSLRSVTWHNFSHGTQCQLHTTQCHSKRARCLALC